MPTISQLPRQRKTHTGRLAQGATVLELPPPPPPSCGETLQRLAAVQVKLTRYMRDVGHAMELVQAMALHRIERDYGVVAPLPDGIDTAAELTYDEGVNELMVFVGWLREEREDARG